MSYEIVKGIKFKSWITVGSIMQAVRVYNLRQVDELILLDVYATNNKKKVDLEMVNEIANECFMPLTFGGGINSIKDISNLLKAGADKVSINTSATKNLRFINEACKTFGGQSIVASVDYKKEGNNIIVYSNSGTFKTNLNFFDYLKDLEGAGVGEVILTSIDRDGTMEGYDKEVLKMSAKNLKIPIIASGGAGDYHDMLDTVQNSKISALAAASIYHFTVKTPRDLKVFLKENRIPVRI